MTDSMDTKRLHLRKPTLDDAAAFAALNACPKVCQFLPSPLTETESLALLQKMIKHFDTHGFGLFAVTLKSSSDYIGFTGLNIPDFDAAFMPAVEIGWRLNHSYWNQGYATEAAIAARDYAFNILNLPELVSFTVPANLASQRVMQKIGMRQDQQGNFNHPKLPLDHRLSEHVLYRMQSNT